VSLRFRLACWFFRLVSAARFAAAFDVIVGDHSYCTTARSSQQRVSGSSARSALNYRRRELRDAIRARGVLTALANVQRQHLNSGKGHPHRPSNVTSTG
jgi:hypothetical protein